MINRRLLRIKALQIIYAFFNKKDVSLQQAEKELLQSIEKTYDLFFFLILILDSLTNQAEKIIDIRMNHKIQTDEDKNPNLKFVNNRVIHLLTNNTQFLHHVNERRITWANEPELMKLIFNKLTETQEYDEYMHGLGEDNFEADRKFVKFIFSDFLYNCQDLYSSLEDKSIYWNYEIDSTIFIIKDIIKKLKEDKPTSFVVPPIFKKEDDKDFVKKLLRGAILNSKEYETIITEQIVNWDYERILKTDKLILSLAISEIIDFESIPVKASMNEYIEIAKHFGSEKSGGFINGVLDKIVNSLKKNNKFSKTGRGLKND